MAPNTDIPALKLLTEREAARILTVSPDALRNWRLRGGGPKFVRVSSRCVRYRLADLIAWTDARVRSSTSDRRKP